MFGRRVALLAGVVGLAVLAAGSVVQIDRRSAPPPSAAGLERLPASFIENRGQWSPRTRFVAWKGDLAAALADDAIRLSRANGPAVTLRFEGAQDATLVGEERQDARHNFVFDDEPAGWRTGVPGFASVRYDELYAGIDVRVREGRGRLEYDVLVAPGAELGRVAIRPLGARTVRLASDGALLLKTPTGTLRQAPPVAWEETPAGRRPLVSRFTVDGATYGFEVDGRDSRLPLVVDPGLDWATYLGGAGDETGPALELTRDGSGDVVVAGQTGSPDFPRTRGNLAPVGYTPYVARLSGDGSRLVYSTFFGGTGNHSVQDVGLDSAGRPAVVGDTTSLDFPTTPGAYDRTPGNGFQGDYDAYLIKFEADGSGPVFGTYLGGAPDTGLDQGWNVLFDPNDAPIVSGITTSASFPTTAGAYDRTNGGRDVFITRFTPDGSALTYSTFFGGAGGEDVFDMELDANGVLTFVGMLSQFPDQLEPFPTTADAFDRTFDGGGSYPGIDGYVARIRLDGNGAGDLKYSTFLGGAQYKEGVTGVALDPNDPTSVTVAGWTYSSDFPTTPGALLRTHYVPVDTSMAFATRFRFGATNTLSWSTLYGGVGNQHANDVTVDSAGNAIIAGATAVDNPPTTPRAYDRIPGIGAYLGGGDAYVAKLSADGSRLLYSTLLGGGSSDESAYTVHYTGGSSVIVGGLTDSNDFPVTPGAYDTVYAADGRHSGGSTPGGIADDAFVAKLTLEETAGDATPPPAPTLRGPATGATYTAHAMNVTFDWSDVSDESGIKAYHLQVSPNPDFNNAIDNFFTGWWEPWLPTSIAVTDFSISETGDFFWRVQALDGANNLGPWSEVRTIVVNNPTPPDAPVLVSPPNDARYGPGTITFDWNPAARAKFYEIQVDTTSNFSNPNRLWVRALTATRFAASFTTEGRRWWRVSASNDSLSNGPWSSVRQFEIKNGNPPQPALPPDNDGGGTPSPNGEATAVAGFVQQELPLLGGTSGQLTVKLNGVAPAGGAVVRLASNFPELASVPASVTVPAGATTASFTVTAPPATRGRPAFVSAAYGSGPDQGIWVMVWASENSPELWALQIGSAVVGSGTGTTNVATMTGGQTATGTVQFMPGWKAPPGGAVVTLGSTDPLLVQVPDRVIVPAGAESATFPVTTSAVPQVARVTVHAARSVTQSIVVELLPAAALTSMTLSPSTVTGGETSTGTVTLSSPAPAGGVTVALSSHDTRWATVPPSVTVPAGATSATFLVSTKVNDSGEGQWSQITASAGGIQRFQTINVNPPGPATPGSLSSMTVTPSTIVGGETAVGRVTLAVAAGTGGVRVDLFSRSALVSVPPFVTVPQGATSATFTVSTTPITGVDQIAWVAAGTTNSSREVQLIITAPAAPPPPAALSGLSVSPASVAGGTAATGTVVLTSAAPSGGFSVSLASSNTAAATVPASVTVPAGATTATFPVTTVAGSTERSTVITATAGAESRTAALTVTATPSAALSTLTLSPSTVTGGATSTGTVTLTAAAPAGGLAVSLSSGNTAAATVPASVTVAAGATSATFTVTSVAGSTNRSAVISAAAGGVTRTATLTVNATPAADTVTIQRAEYDSGNRRLRVEATSSSSGATLRVHVTSTNALIGTLSGGRGEFSWPSNPGSITVRSSLGGSATRTV